MIVTSMSTLVQVVSTQCFKHRTKSCKTGQVVSTLDQVVSTQCFKYKAKRSSSVDTRSSSVDTRDSFQKTFWPIWDSVSTLAQKTFWVNWDSVSTLAQVESTLEAFPEHHLGGFGTVYRHCLK
ncbi:hypothetical protein Taro_047472 [Colocasia esculenta]|uniref:Uncharacterized protein n=1 Tax=Colocasia esculenta TaxID=4460 RepID=A0A843WW92_COLES|nr:hypothetical protein [Colocasia esculenta]